MWPQLKVKKIKDNIFVYNLKKKILSLILMKKTHHLVNIMIFKKNEQLQIKN